MVEAYRTVERYGRRKPTVRMITLMARQVGYKVRDSEAYALLQPFKERAEARPNFADNAGRTSPARGQNFDEASGRSLAAASRARGKGTTSYKDHEESFTLFADETDADTVPPPSKTSARRDRAVYDLADVVWRELEPQLRVPMAKNAWRRKNLDAAEKLLGALGSQEAVLQAWRQSCAFHGEPSVMLVRVAEDLNFGRIGAHVRSPAKEKTALARGFQDPENFRPRTFET